MPTSKRAGGSPARCYGNDAFPRHNHATSFRPIGEARSARTFPRRAQHPRFFVSVLFCRAAICGRQYAAAAQSAICPCRNKYTSKTTRLLVECEPTERSPPTSRATLRACITSWGNTQTKLTPLLRWRREREGGYPPLLVTWAMAAELSNDRC